MAEKDFQTEILRGCDHFGFHAYKIPDMPYALAKLANYKEKKPYDCYMVCGGFHAMELKQVAKYKPKATFVWLKSDRAHIVDPDGVETVAHTMEDVPEDIRNKIAVLQIGTDNSAVINVGVKVDDTKYWVFA